MKKFFISLLTLTSLISLISCGVPNQNGGDHVKDQNCNIYATEYDNISSIEDAKEYLGEVATNLPTANGIIISPYYTMTINGTEVPVYATRTTNTVHSFAYIDVEKIDNNKEFNLDVKLTINKETTSVFSKRKPSVIVLPEKRGIEATLTDNVVTSTIKNIGTFSFVFNKEQDEALTLFVAEKENKEELFSGKEVVYLEPADYSTDRKSETIFEEQGKVYYFKKGRHKIDGIVVPSNSILYLEQGAYLEIIPTTMTYVISNKGEENIKVLGRGLLDFSGCCGSEVPAGYKNNKRGLSFSNVKDMTFSGVTIINAQTWTLSLNACEDVYVSDCLFFGYRVFSDGIMLSDCKNALVEKNFIRTGDDAFETKSTTANGLTENVWFKNNDAWTDKGVAYGCIYESNHDTTDVHFEDCTVGFAMGTWSNHLGCCVIQMGNRKGAKMYDITFNNFEIYTNHNVAILNIFIGGSGGRGEGYGHVDKIYFSNIVAARNFGAVLNLRTYDSENCSIKRVFVDNVTSNGELFTQQSSHDKVNDFVAGGYNFDYLQINTRTNNSEE